MAASGPRVQEICTWVPERCTKQPVLIASRKLKYLSSHQAIDLYIAGNATRTIGQRDTEVINKTIKTNLF